MDAAALPTVTMPNERTLIVESLAREVGARGLRIATRLVGAADAEDAVQEALLRCGSGASSGSAIGPSILRRPPMHSSTPHRPQGTSRVGHAALAIERAFVSAGRTIE